MSAGASKRLAGGPRPGVFPKRLRAAWSEESTTGGSGPPATGFGLVRQPATCLPALATLLLVACTTAGPARLADGRALDSGRAHTELAVAYYQAAQYATAAEEAQAALRAHPAHAPAYNIYGLVLMATGQDASAEAAFARAVALDPQDADARNNRAVLLCRGGRVDEAVRDWDIAARVPYYATPAQSWQNAAACLTAAGRSREAQQWRDRASAIERLSRQPDLTGKGAAATVAEQHRRAATRDAP